MAFSFSNASIENLKNQIDIVDVIGRAVPLKRAGSNYKGLCPFHNEKTPSFVVSEQKQIFTCFGCGASGDVIEFVKRYYNLEFSEAVEKLASEYGIVMERREKDDSREIYYEVNRLAAGYFYRAFTEKPNRGYPYMKKRGFSPLVLKKFGIGYADEKWDSLYGFLLSKGVDRKIMTQLGLVSESGGKYYDKFRNRVIFPIINTGGKVTGFGGRAIDPDDIPKYLNSPESPVFQKKNNLYGLNISKQSIGKEGYVILVEGYMDVLALYQSGVENVAASLGTALTDNQARLITRYTKSAVLSYDADTAGRDADLRGLDVLRARGCKAKVMRVTSGKDPDEFVKQNGKKAFLELVKGALPYGEYKLENAKAGFDLSKDGDKIDYLKKAAEILEGLSPVEQDIYIKRLSGDINVSEKAIRLEVAAFAGSGKRPRPLHREEDRSEDTELSSVEKTLLKILLTDEEYIEKISGIRGIMKSPFAVRLYDLILQVYEKNHRVEVSKIKESLSGGESEKLDQILDQVQIGGNEGKVFDDCVRRFEDMRYAEEENRLLAMLSMADEEDNQDSIKELTEKFMELQKKRKDSSRGI